MSSLSAITVGNFDGVHLGHAALVRAARDAVGTADRVTVLSFDPHPLAILRPAAAPRRLSRFSQRVEWLQRLGADEVVRLEPTRRFLDQSPREFVAWLVERYRPAVVVEGPDFRFGHDRSGDVQTLRDLGNELGFRTIVIDPVEIATIDGHFVRASSSMLRWLVVRGRVRDATRVLGRPFELTGTVVPGDKRGRTIGVPTANLDHDDLLLPADGVYAGHAELPGGTVHPAAISVGRKPTFDNTPRVCETHLLDFDGPLDEYGWTIHVRFDDWLRDQVAFSGVAALADQLQRDIGRARAMAMAVTA